MGDEVLPIMDCTGRRNPKEVPFSIRKYMERSRENMSFRYLKEPFKISRSRTDPPIRESCNVFYAWHFNRVQQYHFL